MFNTLLDLGTLKIHVEADTTAAKKGLHGFEKETKKAESTTRSSSERIKAAFDKVKQSISNLKVPTRSTFSDMRSKLESVKAQVEKVKDSISTKLSPALGKLKPIFKAVETVGVAAFKAITGAIATTAGALGKMTKDAISEYATFEQLSGGAQLMFGDAYDIVAKNAENAYKTVQLSQNEYLEQVNGFAVGLKTALGGNEKAAAELADEIIRAEADVVAATGKPIEAVQNAFNGLMRDEFTMLDNLYLGIKPTKKGFEDLIKTVNKWNKANGKATEYDIDNLADRQKALVDYIKMQELSGRAAEEAKTTITGSIAKTKAAYKNWLLSLGQGNEQAKKSTKELVDSAKITLEQIIPVAVTVISTLADELPSFIEQIKPEIQAAFEKWDVKGTIDNVFSKAADGIAEFDPSSKISDFIANVDNAIKTGDTSQLTGPEKLATTIINEMTETIGNPDNWAHFFSAIATVLDDGLGKLSFNLAEKFAGLFGAEGHIEWSSDPNKIKEQYDKIHGHAAGGVYTKPTLLGNHLVAEAGYSEAIIPLKQSVLATMGAGMAAAYAGAGGNMGTTTVNNYYLNNAVVNQDREIQEMFTKMMNEIRRKGGM